MQLVFKKTIKAGHSMYEIPGLRGSVYFSKSLLADPSNPPATIEVPSEVFGTPGEVKAKISDPEKIAKAQEKAAKAQERATKAADRASKLAEKVRKYQESLASQPQPEAVTA